MWSVWRDDFPLISFGRQEVVDSGHLCRALQHVVVDISQLVDGALEVCAVVREDGVGSASTSDESSKC